MISRNYKNFLSQQGKFRSFGNKGCGENNHSGNGYIIFYELGCGYDNGPYSGNGYGRGAEYFQLNRLIFLNKKETI